MPDRTRRYTIEIHDPDNRTVVFTAADWTDEQCRFAVAQVLRLAGPQRDASNAEKQS
jgi:hypothetical protein